MSTANHTLLQENIVNIRQYNPSNNITNNEQHQNINNQNGFEHLSTITRNNNMNQHFIQQQTATQQQSIQQQHCEQNSYDYYKNGPQHKYNNQIKQHSTCEQQPQLSIQQQILLQKQQEQQNFQQQFINQQQQQQNFNQQFEQQRSEQQLQQHQQQQQLQQLFQQQQQQQQQQQHFNALQQQSYSNQQIEQQQVQTQQDNTYRNQQQQQQQQYFHDQPEQHHQSDQQQYNSLQQQYILQRYQQQVLQQQQLAYQQQLFHQQQQQQAYSVGSSEKQCKQEESNVQQSSIQSDGTNQHFKQETVEHYKTNDELNDGQSDSSGEHQQCATLKEEQPRQISSESEDQHSQQQQQFVLPQVTYQQQLQQQQQIQFEQSLKPENVEVPNVSNVNIQSLPINQQILLQQRYDLACQQQFLAQSQQQQQNFQEGKSSINVIPHNQQQQAFIQQQIAYQQKLHQFQQSQNDVASPSVQQSKLEESDNSLLKQEPPYDQSSIGQHSVKQEPNIVQVKEESTNSISSSAVHPQLGNQIPVNQVVHFQQGLSVPPNFTSAQVLNSGEQLVPKSQQDFSPSQRISVRRDISNLVPEQQVVRTSEGQPSNSQQVHPHQEHVHQLAPTTQLLPTGQICQVLPNGQRILTNQNLPFINNSINLPQQPTSVPVSAPALPSSSDSENSVPGVTSSIDNNQRTFRSDKVSESSDQSSSSDTAGSVPEKSIQVPLRWKRMIANSMVVYISPSNTALSSMEQLKAYLQTQGTCKCGLECPFQCDNVFSFDPKVVTKPWSPLDYHEAPGDLNKLCNHKRKHMAMMGFDPENPDLKRIVSDVPDYRSKKRKVYGGAYSNPVGPRKTKLPKDISVTPVASPGSNERPWNDQTRNQSPHHNLQTPPSVEQTSHTPTPPLPSAPTSLPQPMIMGDQSNMINMPRMFTPRMQMLTPQQQIEQQQRLLRYQEQQRMHQQSSCDNVVDGAEQQKKMFPVQEQTEPQQQQPQQVMSAKVQSHSQPNLIPQTQFSISLPTQTQQMSSMTQAQQMHLLQQQLIAQQQQATNQQMQSMQGQPQVQTPSQIQGLQHIQGQPLQIQGPLQVHSSAQLQNPSQMQGLSQIQGQPQMIQNNIQNVTMANPPSSQPGSAELAQTQVPSQVQIQVQPSQLQTIQAQQMQLQAMQHAQHLQQMQQMQQQYQQQQPHPQQLVPASQAQQGQETMLPQPYLQQSNPIPTAPVSSNQQFTKFTMQPNMPGVSIQPDMLKPGSFPVQKIHSQPELQVRNPHPTFRQSYNSFPPTPTSENDNVCDNPYQTSNQPNSTTLVSNSTLQHTAPLGQPQPVFNYQPMQTHEVMSSEQVTTQFNVQQQKALQQRPTPPWQQQSTSRPTTPVNQVPPNPYERVPPLHPSNVQNQITLTGFNQSLQPDVKKQKVKPSSKSPNSHKKSAEHLPKPESGAAYPSFMDDPTGYLAQQTALLNSTISRQCDIKVTSEVLENKNLQRLASRNRYLNSEARTPDSSIRSDPLKSSSPSERMRTPNSIDPKGPIQGGTVSTSNRSPGGILVPLEASSPRSTTSSINSTNSPQPYSMPSSPGSKSPDRHSTRAMPVASGHTVSSNTVTSVQAGRLNTSLTPSVSSPQQPEVHMPHTIVSKSPLEMVQSVVSSIQMPNQSRSNSAQSLLQPSSSVEAPVKVSTSMPGHILVSSNGQLIMASQPQSQKSSPSVVNASASNIVTNVTGAITQVIPSLGLNQQVLGQQTVLVNTLQAPLLFQPGLMTVDNMNQMQLPQLTVSSPVSSDSSGAFSPRSSQGMISPESAKRKALNKKKKVSPQKVTSMLIAPQQATSSNTGTVVVQQPQGFGQPMLQTLILPNKANFNNQLIATAIQPVNLVQQFPTIQQFLVPAGLGSMVMSQDGTATLLQDTVQLNLLTPVQTPGTMFGGQSILSPNSMLIRSPTSQATIRPNSSATQGQFLTANAPNQFIVNNQFANQLQGQLSPIITNLSPNNQQISFASPNAPQRQNQEYIQCGQTLIPITSQPSGNLASQSNQNTTVLQQNTTMVQQQMTMVQQQSSDQTSSQNFIINSDPKTSNFIITTTDKQPTTNYILSPKGGDKNSGGTHYIITSPSDAKQICGNFILANDKTSSGNIILSTSSPNTSSDKTKPQTIQNLQNIQNRYSISTQTNVTPVSSSSLPTSQMMQTPQAPITLYVSQTTSGVTSNVYTSSPPDTTTLSPVESGVHSPQCVETPSSTILVDDNNLSPTSSTTPASSESTRQAMVHLVSSSNTDWSDSSQEKFSMENDMFVTPRGLQQSTPKNSSKDFVESSSSSGFTPSPRTYRNHHHHSHRHHSHSHHSHHHQSSSSKHHHSKSSRDIHVEYPMRSAEPTRHIRHNVLTEEPDDGSLSDHSNDSDDSNSVETTTNMLGLAEGDLVWGQVKGYPSWPGKLISPAPTQGRVWVKWFGMSNVPLSEVDPSTLKTLSQGLEAHHKSRKKLRKSRKLNSQLENAIQEAMAELDRMSETPQQSRPLPPAVVASGKSKR